MNERSLKRGKRFKKQLNLQRTDDQWIDMNSQESLKKLKNVRNQRNQRFCMIKTLGNESNILMR